MASAEVLEGSASTLAPQVRRGAVALSSIVSTIVERQAKTKFANIFMPTAKVEELAGRLGLEPSPEQKKQALPGSPKKSGAHPRGALAGVPVVVGPNVDLLGVPTTGGNQVLEASKPDADAPVVAALKNAGAFVIGHAVGSELNQSSVGANAAYGSPKNVSQSRGCRPHALRAAQDCHSLALAC